MISICIPTYNINICRLVGQLYDQAESCKEEIEIIIIDDASDIEIVKKNREIKHLCSKFIVLERNVGRSAIRNLFIKEAKNEHLLFLDCDGLVIVNKFIIKLPRFY